MDRPKLILPAALAVTLLGAGCGKKPETHNPPPATVDATVVKPDAAPPDASAFVMPDHDYPVG